MQNSEIQVTPMGIIKNRSYSFKHGCLPVNNYIKFNTLEAYLTTIFKAKNLIPKQRIIPERYCNVLMDSQKSKVHIFADKECHAPAKFCHTY